jgi:thiamine biosynthesis lipoprotein
MDRRAFLRPASLSRSEFHVSLDFQPRLDGRDGLTLVRGSRRAMATIFEVALPHGTPQALPAIEAALDQVDLLEAQLSVYRPESEISAVNRLADRREVPVSPAVFDVLMRAAELSRATDGAFDITAGPLIKTWGFFFRNPRVPTADSLADARSRIGMYRVALDPLRRTVRLAEGMEINLGSIGKGFALDQAASQLRRRFGVTSGLVHGGFSSAIALGSMPGRDDGWLISIRHPIEPKRTLAMVRLRNQGLATSAATYQFIDHDGRRLGHILDPRTGWPAESLASATIIAPTATDADALATACFIQGVDWTREFCRKHPEVGAVILPKDESSPVLINVNPNGSVHS